ncbi:MAG: tRNA epoxyqueuosine(34) reductase QueG [Turicibacter sp.]
MNIKQELIQYSKEIGIDAIGFTDAAPFTELEQILIHREEQGFSSGLTKGSLDEKVNPKLIMADAKSIIAVALAYPRQTDVMPVFDKENPTVQFSRSSWGVDYHHMMNEKLNLIKAWLIEKIPGIEVIPMVDTGLLNDRSVALRSGIGFSGINSSVIHKEFGSYLYLGELLVSHEFLKDAPRNRECGSCRKCVVACPSGAIFEDGGLNEKICLSYVTQSKEILEESLLKKVNKNVYGCDICQEVCPYNKEVDSHLHPQMEATGIEFPQINDILMMTQKEFKVKYGHLAGSWRGVSVIKRNAMLNARFLKYKGALPEIEKIMNGQGPDWLKQAAKLAFDELKD